MQWLWPSPSKVYRRYFQSRTESDYIASREKLWLNELFFPAYLSVLSATSLITYGVLSSLVKAFKIRDSAEEDDAAHDRSDGPNTDDADFHVHVEALGGPVIFTFKALRLLACVILAGLTSVSLLLDTSSTHGYWLGEPTELFLRESGLSARGLSQLALLLTYVSVLNVKIREANLRLDSFTQRFCLSLH